MSRSVLRRPLLGGRRLSPWGALVPVVALLAGVLFATSGRKSTTSSFSTASALLALRFSSVSVENSTSPACNVKPGRFTVRLT